MFAVLCILGVVGLVVRICWVAARESDERIGEFPPKRKADHPPSPGAASVFLVKASRRSGKGKSRRRREDDEDDESNPAPAPDAIPMYYDRSFTTLRSRTPPPVDSDHRDVGKFDGKNAWGGSSKDGWDDEYSRPPSSSSHGGSSRTSSYGAGSSSRTDSSSSPSSCDTPSSSDSWRGSSTSSSSDSSSSSCGSDSGGGSSSD